MKTAINAIGSTCLAVTLAACSSAKDANKANFGKAVQDHLDNQSGLCVAIPASELPFTLKSNDLLTRNQKVRADALREAGALEPAVEYQITEMGKKHFFPPVAEGFGQRAAFCTGKYSIVTVDNFTEPSDAMGQKVSEVNFRYKVDAPAEWARSQGLRDAYKNVANEIQGDIQGKATLILTNNGWMHERMFKG